MDLLEKGWTKSSQTLKASTVANNQEIIDSVVKDFFDKPFYSRASSLDN